MRSPVNLQNITPFTPEQVRPAPAAIPLMPRSKAVRLLQETLAARRIPATVQAGALGLLVCVANRQAERAVTEVTRKGFRGYPVQIERTGAIGSSR